MATLKRLTSKTEMEFRRRIMAKRRDPADISNLFSSRSEKRGNRGHVSGVIDVYLAPTRRLFKPTFILHNLRAVIRLSLRNRPFIIRGGWVLLVDWEQPNHGSSSGPISKRGGKKNLR